MIVKSPPLGQIGVVSDLGLSYRAPVGAWLQANNLRFEDGAIRKIGTAVEVIANPEPLLWLELYDDDIGPRAVAGSATKLYRLSVDLTTWEDVTRLSGDYTSGDWHSFPWGEAVVFNNGVDVPQILEPASSNFIDLPNWGLLTSGQQVVRAKSLRAFNTFMVACNITINGETKPNMVWWSAPAVQDNDDSNFFQPSWDYEDVSTLSGFNYVGVDEGEIIDSLTLGTAHMIYTTSSGYAMQFTGGTFVFSFRKALQYGMARLGAVAEYNNFHYVIAPATIYIHDGSTVRQIADGRVDETFRVLLKAFEDLRCTHDQGNKEIHTLFVDKTDDRKRYLIYNYEEDNFSFGDATVGDPAVPGNAVTCMNYGLRINLGGGSWDGQTETWETIIGTWADKDASVDVRVMYWLTEDGLYVAEDDRQTLDPFKRYYVRSGFLTFAELSEAFNANSVNTVMRILPIFEGNADTQFTLFEAESGSSVQVQAEQNQFDPDTQYKVDFRVTGRNLILEMDIASDGFWEMYSLDYDVEPEYER